MPLKAVLILNDLLDGFAQCLVIPFMHVLTTWREEVVEEPLLDRRANSE